MSSSAFAMFLRFIVVDVVFDVVRFPFWWYTRGMAHVWQWFARQLRNGADRLALVVLAKNLGRPMFGDYTRQGRIISFFVRIVQLAISCVLYAVWVVIHALFVIAWIIVPPAFVLFLVYTFNA